MSSVTSPIFGLRGGEQRLGIAERLADCIEDPRAPERVRHGLAEMIRRRTFQKKNEQTGGGGRCRRPSASCWSRTNLPNTNYSQISCSRGLSCRCSPDRRKGIGTAKG